MKKYSFLFIVFSLASQNFASEFCSEIIRNNFLASHFLHTKNPQLHNSPFINKNISRSKYGKFDISSAPTEKIALWLDFLEKSHFKNSTHPGHKNKIKKFYFKKFLIKKEDIPDSYFDLQRKIANKRGLGQFYFSNSKKNELSLHLISEQRESLESWLDYFLSEDSSVYPIWTKYWVFTSLVKIGKYDKAKKSFAKRTKKTTAPYPELNQEALSSVMGLIIKKINNNEIEEANKMEFAKLYAKALETFSSKNSNFSNIEGKWVKYLQGSNPTDLYDSIRGRNTGWCTAGSELTARSHLEMGDFYVYYTQDKNGFWKNPRLAIRMEGSEIAEIRGVAERQNVDSEIAETHILEKKLEEFGIEGVKYQKRTHDMKILTEIEKKHDQGYELSAIELRFLYEIDSEISGFGYRRDPRISKIKSERSNVVKDLSLALGVLENEISFTNTEALSGKIIYHFGDLNLDTYESLEGKKLPQIVLGSVFLQSLKSLEGVSLPLEINGGLYLPQLQKLNDLKLPRKINGDLNLESLVFLENVIFPEFLKGDVDLSSLLKLKNLTFLSHSIGNLDLGSLSYLEGLRLPEVIQGDLYLETLEELENFEFSKKIEGNLNLSSSIKLKNIIFPEEIWGDLNLESLESFEGSRTPQKVWGNINSELLNNQASEPPTRHSSAGKSIPVSY